MSGFKAFHDGSVVFEKSWAKSIQIESEADRIAIDICLDLLKDRESLETAKRLVAALSQVIVELEGLAAAGRLPAKVKRPAARATLGRNPLD